MINRMQAIVLAVAALGGISAAAVALEHPAAASQDIACLAIGTGVCLSGTVNWVAHAAEISQRPANVMVAMAGDDY